MAYIIGRRPPYGRSSRRWHVVVCGGPEQEVARLDGLGGDHFVPTALCPMAENELAIALAASGGPHGEALPGGLLRWNWRAASASWIWRPGVEQLKAPAGLRLCKDGRLLITDTELHHVVCLDEGRCCWTFGSSGVPGAGGTRLRGPQDCFPGPHGFLIADTLNHRVLVINDDGRVQREIGGHDAALGLCEPKSAFPLLSGRLLVADTGRGRVLELDSGGPVVRRWGPSRDVAACLSLPRSIGHQAGGGLIVADTNHHRVLGVDRAGRLAWQLGRPWAPAGIPMDWPRCARALPGGKIAIADSRNGRILITAPDGRDETLVIERLLTRSGRPIAFGDVHDMRVLSRNRLLLTDSDLRCVAEMTLDGQLLWSFGLDNEGHATGDLLDPHQALRLSCGDTLISDCYNHRLLRIAPNGAVVRVWRSFKSEDGSLVPVVKPRAIALHPQGFLFSDDASMVHLCRWDGSLIWSIGPEVGTGAQVGLLGKPRDLFMSAAGTLFISDYENGRIYEVQP